MFAVSSPDVCSSLQLEAQVIELKRQNQFLRGHVTEIHELRDERDRLRQRVLELTNPKLGDTVVKLKHRGASKLPKSFDLPMEIVDALRQAGFEPTIRLNREIKQHSVEAVLTAIEAFMQYRSKAVVDKPGACLLSMIRNEDTPNISNQAITPEQQEFDEWYAEATRRGFCQDVPKKYLSEFSGEIQVRIDDTSEPSGYVLMGWRKAKEQMGTME